MNKKYANVHDLKTGVPVMVFDSVEELDKHAGTPGTALEWANKWLMYRLNMRASDVFCQVLQERTKFERKKGQSNGDYVRSYRAAVESCKLAIEEPLAEFLQRIADSIVPIVWNPSDYVKKTTKASQKATEQAKIIIANGNAQKWYDRLAKDGITVVTNGSYDQRVNSLAAGIDALKEREMERTFI